VLHVLIVDREQVISLYDFGGCGGCGGGGADRADTLFIICWEQDYAAMK